MQEFAASAVFPMVLEDAIETVNFLVQTPCKSIPSQFNIILCTIMHSGFACVSVCVHMHQESEEAFQMEITSGHSMAQKIKTSTTVT